MSGSSGLALGTKTPLYDIGDIADLRYKSGVFISLNCCGGVKRKLDRCVLSQE
jgi:hypothetical protein